MNVEFLKDGTNFWACVRNSYTVTIQMKPLLLDWWKKSCSVMISEIKLFGGTFFSQHFYNKIFINGIWRFQYPLLGWNSITVSQFVLSTTCPQKKKKKIKNTTCIKTVIFASCGTFIGNSVPSSLLIMHFLLTCITIKKTTVLTTCMLILMFMLMLQYWSKTVHWKSQFSIPAWMENREQVIENCIVDWASQD